MTEGGKMMNDREHRLNRLKQFITITGEVEHKKRLHSLVFLCEFLGTDLGQDFDFRDYQLYSPTLARDIESADVNELNSKEELISESNFAVVEQLKFESDNTLELLSVLCYLHRVGYTNEQLPVKIEELKPELSNSFDRAYELAEKHFSIKVKQLAHK